MEQVRFAFLSLGLVPYKATKDKIITRTIYVMLLSNFDDKNRGLGFFVYVFPPQVAAGNLVPKWHLTRDALGTRLAGESLTIKYKIKIFIKSSFLYTYIV